jgi:hypothetical protein
MNELENWVLNEEYKNTSDVNNYEEELEINANLLSSYGFAFFFLGINYCLII